ncbi:MAG: hypothetical protein AAF705_06875 [Bacteroidota bacterium]
MKTYSKLITYSLILFFSLSFYACEKEDNLPHFRNFHISTVYSATNDLLIQAPIPVIQEGQNQVSTNTTQPAIVKFDGGNQDPIEGYLFMPGTGDSQLNFVILLHGSGGALDGADDNTNAFTGKSSLTSQYENWVDDLLAEGYGVFVINSFKGADRARINGESDYIGVKPPNDAPFTPYRVRAEDVKQGVARLKGLVDHDNFNFVGDIALLGFSHGATAAIAAVHDYSHTQIGGPEQMMEWSVKSSSIEYDGPDYDAPFSNQNTDVVAAIAYYGGTYGFGYFTDYAQGQGAAYKYQLNKHLMVHHGTSDNTVRIGSANSKWTPRGFENHILQGNANQNIDFEFMEWQNASHSFDMPHKNAQADVNARNGARTETLDFLDDYIG